MGLVSSSVDAHPNLPRLPPFSVGCPYLSVADDDRRDCAPTWVLDRYGYSPETYKAEVLPILAVDGCYHMEDGLVLCYHCHRALSGLKAVHNHFSKLGHDITARVREFRSITRTVSKTKYVQSLLSRPPASFTFVPPSNLSLFLHAASLDRT